MSTVTFGIEEEFVLLDRGSLATVDLGDAAVAQLGGDGEVAHEFQASQLEYSTPVLESAHDALEVLAAFRARLAVWAADHGVVAAGTGTPYRIGARTGLHENPRYARIPADIGALSAEHQTNGLHVHIGIGDRDDGVAASNALRPWLPLLLALSANSPYWGGQDSGFASWRALHARRWTTHGIPPVFADAADLDRTLASLAGLGATSDPGTINWNVRLSASHPTVEIRTCDAQLSADRAVALALLVRALADESTRQRTPIEPAPGVWDAALWHAARHGVGGTLLDPMSRTVGPARHAVRTLMRAAAPALRALGDLDRVEAFVGSTLRTGVGATHQWRSRRHGVGALADLYRRELTSADAATPSSARLRVEA